MFLVLHHILVIVSFVLYNPQHTDYSSFLNVVLPVLGFDLLISILETIVNHVLKNVDLTAQVLDLFFVFVDACLLNFLLDSEQSHCGISCPHIENLHQQYSGISCFI